MSEALALEARTGLPDALRVLYEAYPREVWETHPNFGGLVTFWLDRHMMFRKLCAILTEEAEARIDGTLDARRHAGNLSRYGGMLVQQLHGHHQIEDHHYFPALSGLEPELVKGFTLLDSDHHAMDGLLDRFSRAANGVLREQVETGLFRDELLSFAGLLERHLVDEEDLIVPVLLKYGEGALS